MDLYLEITAVILGIGYLYFLIREQIICWFFGIFSSLASIFLFYRTGLYSESILYMYYVLIGIYGFIIWKRPIKKGDVLPITDLSSVKWLYIVIFGEIAALILGAFFDIYTDAVAPYLDSNTTIFSFIASYLEAKKSLASWKLWIVINAVTILLYFDRDLIWYTFLTLVYLVFSFVGYFRWRQKWKLISVK